MRMLYKKGKFGTKYTRFLTSSSLPVVVFFALGLAGLCAMAASIELDIMTTYPAKLDLPRLSIVVESVDAMSPGKLYAYSNRNESVATLAIDGVAREGSTTTLRIASVSAADATKLPEHLFIDVPTGKESLLARIVLKAGKNHE